METGFGAQMRTGMAFFGNSPLKAATLLWSPMIIWPRLSASLTIVLVNV